MSEEKILHNVVYLLFLVLFATTLTEALLATELAVAVSRRHHQVLVQCPRLVAPGASGIDGLVRP